MPRFLALDCGHCAAVGTLVLYNADKTDFFLFDTAAQLKEFTLSYYKNPIATLFAYKNSMEPCFLAPTGKGNALNPSPQ